MNDEKEYSLTINNKVIHFTSNDSEEHVNALKTKIKETIESLSAGGTAPILSDFVMKLAFTLADDAVRAERELKIREDVITQKCRQLLTIFE